MKGKGKCKSVVRREPGEEASEKVNQGGRGRPRRSADSKIPPSFSFFFFLFSFLHLINSMRHFEDDLCVSSA